MQQVDADGKAGKARAAFLLEKPPLVLEKPVDLRPSPQP